jgi:hypothetical protein
VDDDPETTIQSLESVDDELQGYNATNYLSESMSK